MKQFNTEQIIILLSTSEKIKPINDWSVFTCAKVAENITNNTLILPNNTAIQLIEHLPDWNVNFETNRNSNYLWLYSLNYIGSLLSAFEKSKNKEYLEIATKILFDFTEKTNKDSKLRDDVLSLNKSGGSIDHSISLRTNAIIKFLNLISFNTLSLKKQVELSSTLCDAINWMYADENYSDNNHGTMVDICLTQAGRFFGEKSLEGRALIKKAADRVKNGVLTRFDQDGLANENTIGYHRYNITLFQSAATMLADTLEGNSALLEINRVLFKARDTLSMCVWQNGSIPPIGDSRVYEKITKSINISKSFTESGFGIIKDDDTYISLICGNRGRSHKQVDDTSLTLRHCDTDLLVDSGNYSYDKNNPIRKSIASTYGHSGIFPEYIEGISPQSYPQQGTTFSISEIQKTDLQEFISCQVHYGPKNTTIKRKITYIKPDTIIITDEVNNPNQYNIIDRWLFGPNFKSINEDDNGILTLVNSATHEAVKNISISRQARSQRRHLHIGSTHPIHRGFYSIEPNIAIPIMELSHISNEAFIFLTTIIKIKKN